MRSETRGGEARPGWTARQAEISVPPAPREHVPVLIEEVVSFLARPNAVLVDGTLGDGGHARALLDVSPGESRLLGLDLDQDALAYARSRLAPCGDRVQLVHETFAHVAKVATREGLPPATGILFDLGMSTRHLGVERGFSFHNLGTLDMRFDASGTIPLPEPEHPGLRVLARRNPAYTAADVLAGLRAEELAELFRTYGGEHHALRIGAAIVRARSRAVVRTVPELVHVIVRALPPPARHGRIHAATRVFQALRIAVNREQETLREGLAGALSLLAPGGRLAVISFHSGEDRLVKQWFRDAAHTTRARLLTKHPIRPTPDEIQRNPWSRSAKLRVLERCS